MVMQTITVNNVAIELTAQEAKVAHKLASMRLAGPQYAQTALKTWYNEAPTKSARMRRRKVGEALNLTLD